MSGLIPVIEAYLDFVFSSSRQSEDKDANIFRLIRILDDLAIQAHQSGTFVQDTDPDEESLAYRETYEHIGRHFSDFGYYPIALKILDPNDPTAGLADAIDDLTDIAIDLQAALATAKRTGEAAAQYAFVSSYRIHWGAHLRDLQRYLHSQLIGY